MLNDFVLSIDSPIVAIPRKIKWLLGTVSSRLEALSQISLTKKVFEERPSSKEDVKFLLEKCQMYIDPHDEAVFWVVNPDGEKTLYGSKFAEISKDNLKKFLSDSNEILRKNLNKNKDKLLTCITVKEYLVVFDGLEDDFEEASLMAIISPIGPLNMEYAVFDHFRPVYTYYSIKSKKRKRSHKHHYKNSYFA
jgi:hypothetical protein